MDQFRSIERGIALGTFYKNTYKSMGVGFVVGVYCFVENDVDITRWLSMRNKT